MHFKDFDCRFKADGEDAALNDGEFIAYPSTFTREPDCYGDVVANGAFDKTIKAWQDSGNTLPVLYGHRMDDPDYNIGGVDSMGEDDHGWWIKGHFDMDSPKAAQVYHLIKEKRLTQLSFAFDVVDEGEVELDDGTKANELRELKVYEASFVPIGANQDTGIVDVKDALSRLKTGRPISQKNLDILSQIADDLTGQAKKLKDFVAENTTQSDNNNDNDQSDDAKASDAGAAKNEEPEGAKSEEPDGFSEAEALQLAIKIARIGRKGE